jgi:hypothetical protein
MKMTTKMLVMGEYHSHKLCLKVACLMSPQWELQENKNRSLSILARLILALLVLQYRPLWSVKREHSAAVHVLVDVGPF